MIRHVEDKIIKNDKIIACFYVDLKIIQPVSWKALKENIEDFEIICNLSLLPDSNESEVNPFFGYDILLKN